MFLFEYQLNCLEKYASQLSEKLAQPIVDGYLSYPESIAKGGSKFVNINDYITIQIAQYIATDEIKFIRQPTEKNHLTISFQDFTFVKCHEHNFSCNEIIANNNSMGSIQTKSTTIEEIVIIHPGVKINVLLIHFKENWENHVFRNGEVKAKLTSYFVQDNANIRKEFLTAEQHNLLKQIMLGSNASISELLFYQSKIFALLENFFTEILNNENNRDQSIYASIKDVEMVQLAEKYITQNLSKPFMGVDELAKMCYMSRTKFIVLFQKIYNISSYDYYQKNRLALAYNLILESNKTIQEIAENIGYSKVQNFNLAFEKEFGLLPRNMQKEKSKLN